MGLVGVAKKALKLAARKKIVPIVRSIPNEKLLEGRLAFITGGSGGIGFAIAQAFVDAGAKVVLAGQNEERLRENCQALGAAAKYVVFDVTDIEGMESVVNKVAGLFDDVDLSILVNGAGVHHAHSFWEIDEDEFSKIMDVNVKATFFLSRTVAKHMVENRIEGNILNISSSSALRPAWGPYHISKWALRGMTIGFAQKLQGQGIVVNAIAPGQTATQMLGVDPSEGISNDYALSGRYIMPEEVASFAVQLVSGAGRMVVGDTCYITGGSGIVTLNR